MDDFAWDDNDDVVLPEREQQAIALYENAAGGIVLRQQARWPDRDDKFVVVLRENLARLIDALGQFVDPSNGGGTAR